MKTSYKKAGVDVKKAEEFIKGIGRLLKSRKGDAQAFGSLFDLCDGADKVRFESCTGGAGDDIDPLFDGSGVFKDGLADFDLLFQFAGEHVGHAVVAKDRRVVGL